MTDGNHNSIHTVLICTKCRGADGAAALRSALAEQLPEGFSFRAVDCMAGCDRKATVGFQSAGKATYLFGDIEGVTDIAALAAFAHQYRDSAHGWTNATERPAELYEKTLARLPGSKFESSL